MIKKLINPFNNIAGGKSLIIGLIGMIATCVAAYYTKIIFYNTISTTYGQSSFLFLGIQALINWLSISILLYMAALLFSKSSIRLIDIFGTQAFARLPFLLAAIFTFPSLSKKLMDYALNIKAPINITSGDIILIIIHFFFAILAVTWMITLSVNAYKVSANLKGTKLTVIYIICLMISIFISNYAFSLLYKCEI